MNKKLYLILGGVFLIIAVLQIPTNQNRVLSYGVDTYNAHMPLYGESKLQQYLYTENMITGIGAILVDLRRSNNLADVTVEVTDTDTNEKLISQAIEATAIQDDTFAYTAFSDTPISRGRNIQIVFTAPQATHTNAIGLRVDPNNKDLAIAITERTPLWKSIRTAMENKLDAWIYISFAIFASCIIALPALLPHSKKSWAIALICIIIAAIGIRIVLVPHFGGVSGGDAYNYLSISQTISTLKNPFENTKRLPGYPLILTPFYASGIFDDHRVMRYVQIFSSITGIILIAGIARILQLSWPTALAASAILAFQKDYYWTSLRPEPYSLYTALLLASLFFFFKGYANKKVWAYVAFGLCLGYGAMVRQEGFMAAAILGTCSVLYESYEIYIKKSQEMLILALKRFTAMYVPALLLVLPFFLNNLFTYGHPLYTEYFEGERLQIVNSFGAFQDALGATWGVVGSMWKPSWDSLQRIQFSDPVFIISAIALIAWYALLKYYSRAQNTLGIAVFACITFILLALCSVYAKNLTANTLPLILAAWIVASVPLFLTETKWRGLVILIVVVSQIGVATWFHPFPKHYQQSYPIIVLMIATGLLSQIRIQNKLLTISTLALATFPFFIIAVYLSKNINAEIDRYNANTALDSVIYRASRYARQLPGPIGFDQAYLPARLYFDPDAKYFPDEDHPTLEMEQEWLAKNHLQTIVVTNGNNVFKQIPSNWIKIKDFKAAGDDEKIFIGTIYDISP